MVYEVLSWDRCDLEVDGLLESTITTRSVVSGPSRVNEDRRSEDGLAGLVGAGIEICSGFGVVKSGGDMPRGWGVDIVICFGFIDGNIFSVEAVIPIGMAADVAEVHLARSIVSLFSFWSSSSVFTSGLPLLAPGLVLPPSVSSTFRLI